MRCACVARVYNHCHAAADEAVDAALQAEDARTYLPALRADGLTAADGSLLRVTPVIPGGQVPT
jgi:hypothetical protein